MPPTLGPATDTTSMVEPAAEAHVEVERPGGSYQRMIAAYREPDRTKGRELIQRLLNSVCHGRPLRAGPEVRLSAA